MPNPDTRIRRHSSGLFVLYSSGHLAIIASIREDMNEVVPYRATAMAIERSQNPEPFFGFERAGWDATTTGYDQAFGPVSRQAVVPLLKAASVSAGMRVLDVCSGAGMLLEA